MSRPLSSIRRAGPEDAPALGAIGRELAEDGTAYVFAPDATEAELVAYWLDPSGVTFVAEDEAGVAGCYLLRANQPGRGSHVATASYAVAERARGRGVGEALARHSLDEARARGFRAMQFNLVVSTNEGAVALWRKLGFEVVGVLPRAFDHARLGLVDAFVMHRFL